MAVYDLMHKDSGTYDITRHCKQGYNSVIFQNKATYQPHHVFIYLLTPKSSQILPKRFALNVYSRRHRVFAKVLTSFKQDDDDLVVEETRLSLRCPLSLAMLNIPARGSVCKHAQCFDLESYVSMNRKRSTASAKNRWKCPLCWKSVPRLNLLLWMNLWKRFWKKHVAMMMRRTRLVCTDRFEW